MPEHLPDTPAPLLNSHDAARWLGVSERTLARLKDDGLPYVRVSAQVHRFRPAALEAWAMAKEQRETPPTSAGG